MDWTPFDRPDYDNMMSFTQGRWDTMGPEEQDVALKEYELWLPQRRAEMHQDELLKKWEQLCPPIYRDSNPELLPNLPMFEEVQKWEYGPQGLLLKGPSRQGKTRAAWALLKRLHFQEERKIVAFVPKDLKAAVADEWRDRDRIANDWRDRCNSGPDITTRLRRAEVLYLDDLDTIKFTEAVEETLYDTFEYRLAHGKPVILTLNQSGPELAGRMSTEARGEKITARMRESCRVINFG